MVEDQPLAALNGQEIPVRFDSWRPGDQPCYVSDIRKAERVMGWRPTVDKETGIGRLWEWVAANPQLFQRPQHRVARKSSGFFETIPSHGNKPAEDVSC